MTDSILDTHKQSLGHLLASVSRLVGGRMRMRLEEIGLPHAQGMILFFLWRKDGTAQNVIARSLHITPPTATSTLQRMERDGWVQRRRDPGGSTDHPGVSHGKGKGASRRSQSTFSGDG